MGKTVLWIVVTNASEARIFESVKGQLLNGSAELRLVNELSHPESRKKLLDLTTDKSGYNSKQGSGHGNFVDSTDPKEYEATQFAKIIAKELDEGRINHSYEQIILVAAPHFHGILNKEANDHVSQCIIRHIKKDYTKDNERELLSHLDDYL